MSLDPGPRDPRSGENPAPPTGDEALFGRGSAVPLSTPQDRGLVETPVLLPHLAVRSVESRAVLLVSETSQFLLFGERWLDIVPLIDGVRTRHQIVAELEGRHSRVAVQTALVSMATKGYLVSADFRMDRQTAAFWTTHGASPRWAEARLEAARVAVVGDAPGLAADLEALDLRLVESDAASPAPTLVVVLADDYLDESLEAHNRRHLESGVPWTLVRHEGARPLFGPVFRPAEGGPCWACLAHRIRGNREVENYLRRIGGGAAWVPPTRFPGPFTGGVRGFAATEIAKWVVLARYAPLHDRVISFESVGMDSPDHFVMRRPQCRACGDEALWRSDREPASVVLGPSPKPIRNSGGARSVTPEETLARYRKLVSPVSGVVTQLVRVTDPADPWLHVFWSGSNLSLKSDTLYLLRSSIRNKSAGKGATAAQAEASALCEALERYSGVFHGDEIRRRARLRDFTDGEAIHPNEVQLYSEWQFANAARLNARMSRFNYVPERLEPDIEISWTPVWSFTEERHRFLPTQMLYFASPAENGVVYAGPDSNGCAAGNTLEEAILQGFFELAERDGFACWWYNRCRIPEVDLASFDDPWITRARDYYARHHRDLWVLDATTDLNIPVFVAVSRRTDKEVEDILFSAGAHFDPHIALQRAVAELNQYFNGVRAVAADGTGYFWDDPESLWWWQTQTLAMNPWLAPDPDAKRRRRTDYRPPDTTDTRDDVEACRALVEGLGMEFLVLDQTRQDIGMPVAKTIVPGLRHFWARQRAGRLYEVPVRMGWLDRPREEAELNPIPVFI